MTIFLRFHGEAFLRYNLSPMQNRNSYLRRFRSPINDLSVVLNGRLFGDLWFSLTNHWHFIVVCTKDASVSKNMQEQFLTRF